jgi:hypothetical protein
MNINFKKLIPEAKAPIKMIDVDAGFEWLDDHTIRKRGKLGTGVCYKPECGIEAKKRSNY